MHIFLENQEKYSPEARIRLRKVHFDAIKGFLEQNDCSSVSLGVKEGFQPNRMRCQP
jgi:hypothetical protein